MSPLLNILKKVGKFDKFWRVDEIRVKISGVFGKFSNIGMALLK